MKHFFRNSTVSEKTSYIQGTIGFLILCLLSPYTEFIRIELSIGMLLVYIYAIISTTILRNKSELEG